MLVAWKGAVDEAEDADGARRRGGARARARRGAAGAALRGLGAPHAARLPQGRAHAGALSAARGNGRKTPVVGPIRPHGSLVSGGAMGTVYAIANQKGGVGQDHDGRQRRRLHRRGRLRDAAGRRDPQGNATVGLGLSRHEGPGLYEVLSGDVDRRATPCADRHRAPLDARLDARPGRRDDGAAAAARLGGADARRARLRPRRLRLHAARLPAVARPADRQRAGRRRPRDRAGADGVLRARGARRAARHARADPARAEPAARRSPGCC